MEVRRSDLFQLLLQFVSKSKSKRIIKIGHFAKSIIKIKVAPFCGPRCSVLNFYSDYYSLLLFIFDEPTNFCTVKGHFHYGCAAIVSDSER